MDQAVRKRFAAVFEATGLQMQEASLAPNPPLGKTYVSEFFRKGKGSLEGILRITKAIAPEYHQFVHLGVGDPPPVSGIPRKQVLNKSEISARRPVPVVGYAGAGGMANFEPIPGEGEIEADVPEGTVAVRIRGSSLGPGFDGWYALYSQRREPFTDDLYGGLCVVGTTDGRTLVKWVRRGLNRLTNLVSGTGEIEEGVALEWAAKVIDLRPY